MSNTDLPSEPLFLLHPNDPEARLAADRLFKQIEAELRSLLTQRADIRHIGATAVPGCVTKGDLDVVVRVPAEKFAATDRLLATRFARNLGSKRTATFAAFADDNSVPHLGVQLTTVGGEDDYFHVFVDRLLRDPELVARYNALKTIWDGKPMDDYRAAKSVFITTVLMQS
jgi:GrpB-like predicted nucleotidyltransferase (UPF0157 family)